MGYFIVIVHGEGDIHFGFNEDGSPHNVNGFLTTSIFKAKTLDKAKDFALLRIDERWRNSDLFGLLSGDLMLCIESIEEISAFRYYRAKVVNFFQLGGYLPTIPNKGHIFY